MPITLLRNEDIDLNLLIFSGTVTVAELRSVTSYQARERASNLCDVIHIVEPEAEFVGVTPTIIHGFREHYRQLFGVLDVHLMRRSAWICHSPQARSAFVDGWLHERHPRDGLYTDVRLIGSLDEAAEFLMLRDQDRDALMQRRGFREVFRLNGEEVREGA